jgi:hypothetical protein
MPSLPIPTFGGAFGDPDADEGASLQPELVVELIDDILEIIGRANRLGDHFVETVLLGLVDKATTI